MPSTVLDLTELLRVSAVSAFTGNPGDAVQILGKEGRIGAAKGPQTEEGESGTLPTPPRPALW